MHSNPGFLQGRAYVQFAFGGTPEQLKTYIDEALSNSKVVVLKADISNVYVKRYIDSNMAYADSLYALIPRSILTVKIQLCRWVNLYKNDKIIQLINL